MQTMINFIKNFEIGIDMNKIFLLASVLFLSGCLVEPGLHQDEESDDVVENSDTSEDVGDFEEFHKEVDVCGSSYTYHTIVFDDKSHLVKLPIPCSQEIYIEKGTPSELDDKFEQHSVTVKTISY